jgi:peptide chain release factor subunit 3
MLVKASGIRYLVVLINKMDDPTANWDQTRYDGIKDKLILKEHPGEQFLPWYK